MKKILYTKLRFGFFIYPKNGNLYYAYTHGELTAPFLVTDGIIADKANLFSIKPDEEVEVQERDDWPIHGINDETLKKRFKELS
jgi:hypothetical protein